MDELILRVLVLIVPIAVIFYLGLFMPRLVRKEIFFGVRIPRDRLETDAVRAILLDYQRLYRIFGGLLALGLTAAVLYKENPPFYTLGFFLLMICSLMGFFYVQMIFDARFPAGVSMGVPVGFTVLILLVTLGLAFSTGQGGSRVRVASGQEGQPAEIDRKDDQCWKLGLFYYNPQDPAMFVEKRFGIGWTINFGNWKADFITVAVLLFVFLLILMTL
jgi:uncharacterized membrane protein